MKENNKKLPDRYRKFNCIVFTFTYLLFASFLFIVIGDLKENIVLVFVILFLLAPFFSLMILLVLLRLEHFNISGDGLNLLHPAKGSISDPNIDKFIGTRGVRFLNILVAVLTVLLVLTFAWQIYNWI
jgi:Mn2+/Fe2+ NRAMP family transporter